MKTALEQPTVKKTIFEMTPQELQQKIKPTAERLKKETFDKNTYFSYYDEALCPGDDTLIHEYKDRKELVRIDDNGDTELIRIL